MANIEVKIKTIRDKLQQLLKQQVLVQKENNRLQQELDMTRKQLAAQQKNIEELKQQVDVLKLNAGEMSEQEKKEFEKRISAYIREIDRCMAMLESN